MTLVLGLGLIVCTIAVVVLVCLLRRRRLGRG
jgi:hypothetical protein